MMAPIPWTRYVEILWPEKITAGDLEIVDPATDETPGKIKILKASIRKRSGSGNGTLASEELFSTAGEKIGFVAPISMLTDGPFDSSYYLILAAEPQPEMVDPPLAAPA
jgi:hypothetical protein